MVSATHVYKTCAKHSLPLSLKGYAFWGLFSGNAGNAGIIGISGKSPIIPIIPSVPIVPYINLCAQRTTLLRQNFVMPRLCYGSAEQVNLLCSLLNRKVHLSPFSKKKVSNKSAGHYFYR